jgi:hypothetical protein
MYAYFYRARPAQTYASPSGGTLTRGNTRWTCSPWSGGWTWRTLTVVYARSHFFLSRCCGTPSRESSRIADGNASRPPRRSSGSATFMCPGTNPCSLGRPLWIISTRGRSSAALRSSDSAPAPSRRTTHTQPWCVDGEARAPRASDVGVLGRAPLTRGDARCDSRTAGRPRALRRGPHPRAPRRLARAVRPLAHPRTVRSDPRLCRLYARLGWCEPAAAERRKSFGPGDASIAFDEVRRMLRAWHHDSDSRGSRAPT